MPARSIAAVIVNYRTPVLTLGALRALGEAREPNLHAVLVDGGSEDGSGEMLATAIKEARFADWVKCAPLPINGGFGWANNQAILALLQSPSPPDYIYLLNPDTEVTKGAVSALADVLDVHPRCGAVGSQLLEQDGTLAGSAFDRFTPRSEIGRGAKTGLIDRLLRLPPFRPQRPAGEVDWVTGASVMFRSDALRETGLFDTGFFLYFEEVELMARMRRHGWTIRHEPASRVKHVGGAATGVNGSRPTAIRPALPAYWYQSRRRYFTLTGGAGTAIAASLGWMLGNGLLLARRLIGSGRNHSIVDREARRLIAHGLRPKRAKPSFPNWDEKPGKPPAWMD